MFRSLKKIHRYSLTLYKKIFRKKFGSYNSKNVVFGPEKPLFGPIFRREEVFRGLKQRFLNEKTQIFFKKAVHKGLNDI